MSTAARKARKRAGIRFERTPKTAPHVEPMTTGRRRTGKTRGLGLVSGAEILTGLLIRGAL